MGFMKILTPEGVIDIEDMTISEMMSLELELREESGK